MRAAVTPIVWRGYDRSVPAGDAIAISSDGERAYVTSTAAASVSVLDTRSKSVVRTIDVGKSPLGVAVSLDGRYAYVVSNRGTVAVINTGTESVVNTINVSDRLTALYRGRFARRPQSRRCGGHPA
jgi:YVTN family beta-propeller protein